MTTEQNKPLDNKSAQTAETKPAKANEVGGFFFSSHFKISDPETQEVFVQARGD